MVNHHGQLVGKAVLLRGHLHTAAVILPFHGRCNPDVVELVLYAVNRNLGMAGLKVEQQALDGDAGIVDFLLRVLFLDPVGHFTAVSVNSEAHVVDKELFHPVHVHGGKVRKIRVDQDLFPGLPADIRQEIVAGSASQKVDVVFDFGPFDRVDEVVQGAVPADEDHFIVRSQAFQILRIIQADCIHQFRTGIHIRLDAVIRQRIVQIVFHIIPLFYNRPQTIRNSPIE